MKRYERPVAEMIDLLIDEEIMGGLPTTGSMGEDGSNLPWQEP